MNLGRVFTKEEAGQFFNMILACNAAAPGLGYHKVFLEEEGAATYLGLGALNPNEEDGTVEIEYMLLPAYWHRGYGTRLLRQLAAQAFAACGSVTLAAITDPENIWSQHMLEKQGFQLVEQYVNSDGEPALLYQMRCTAAP